MNENTELTDKTKLEAAVEQVEAFILEHWLLWRKSRTTGAHLAQVQADSPKVRLVLWDDLPFVGVRVAEISMSWQSAPCSCGGSCSTNARTHAALVVCAAAERMVLCLLHPEAGGDIKVAKALLLQGLGLPTAA